MDEKLLKDLIAEGPVAIEFRPPQRWPWWLRWIAPVYTADSRNKLVRCSCGRALWLLSAPQVRRHHHGHRMTIIQDGTFWEFIQLKTGLLDCRNFSELFRDYLLRFQGGHK
jgi:hypothetical protein